MLERLCRNGAAVLLSALVLSGIPACSLVSTSGSCIDWISVETPADRFREAPVVVVADVAATDRTVEASGVYSIHRARIRSVLKGTVSDRSIDLINPSDQCTASGRSVEYLDGDDLADDGSRVLYLHEPDETADVWRLIVPNAVDPARVASALPHGH